MNKTKTILLIVSILVSLGSYYMYTSNILYWNAYAYEISLTDDIEPEFTIEVTSQDLVAYPELAALLEEVDQSEYALMTFEEGDAIYQYEDLLDSKEPENPYDFIYLQTETQSYVVYFTMYGGMETMPIYLWISGGAALIAIGLAITLVLGYLKSRN